MNTWNSRRLRMEQMEQRIVLTGSSCELSPDVHDSDECITALIQVDDRLTVALSASADASPSATADGRVLREPALANGSLPAGLVFAIPGNVDFAGKDENHVVAPHFQDLELTNGTIAFRFTADRVDGRYAVFSKDYAGPREGGDITALLEDGQLKVRLESVDDSQWLTTPEGDIVPGREYHVTISFGEQGFWLYLDGEMLQWKTYYTQGLSENTQPLLIGATGWSRDAANPDRSHFDFSGSIADFLIIDSQLSHLDVAELAGVREQPLSEPTIVDGVLRGTDFGELLNASREIPRVDGGFGDDILLGSTGDDVLDGGFGEDGLAGGPGDDLIISRSDGGEPPIAQNYDDIDDPNGEIDPQTRTFYTNQSIAANDILVGGEGADTFRFEILMNAKPDKLVKRADDNGIIHWHSIAKENDDVHDHWVEGIGNDVIWDFNRAEGDRIELLGHTLAAHRVEHIDVDGDGVLDASVIGLFSAQGPLGAHTMDPLGSVTVYGDLVMESDLFVDRHPHFGVIRHIRDIELAKARGRQAADEAPLPPPFLDDGSQPIGGVFALPGVIPLNRESRDHIEVDHFDALNLQAATISFRFTSNNVDGFSGLISKDFMGDRSGELTAMIEDGQLKVRLESLDSQQWLSTQPGSIQRGREYHFAVTFGEEGYHLYLDGVLQDSEANYTVNWRWNDRSLLIGAIGWSRDSEDPDRALYHLDGSIADLAILSSQLGEEAIARIASQSGLPNSGGPRRDYAAPLRAKIDAAKQ